jgi:hypothetical protein
MRLQIEARVQVLLVAFGPNIDGIGFRRAFPLGGRGFPCTTRGSFINVESSLAGTVAGLV